MYKRVRAEEAMTSRVIDVCFVIWFFVLWRDAGGINWEGAAAPVYRLLKPPLPLLLLQRKQVVSAAPL